MLQPVQTSGEKPPLFFVHGLHGIMPLGRGFARVLGPDQPVYVINANGIDGKRPVIDNVPEMALAYAEEIQQARPTGRIHVAGMCDGALVAIEVTRRLQESERDMGPVILADPPAVLRAHGREKQFFSSDPTQPDIARQLYNRAQQ